MNALKANTLDAKKKRFKKSKIYGLFRREPDGKLYGYVENSFDMSWEVDFVRVWRGFSKGLQNDLKLAQSRYGVGNVFITRFNSKDCPVSIAGWKPSNPNFAFQKRNWRNAPFKVKVN